MDPVDSIVYSILAGLLFAFVLVLGKRESILGSLLASFLTDGGGYGIAIALVCIGCLLWLAIQSIQWYQAVALMVMGVVFGATEWWLARKMAEGTNKAVGAD